MGDVLSIVTSLIAGSIRVSIPIAFAALGGTLSEPTAFPSTPSRPAASRSSSRRVRTPTSLRGGVP